jgi:hypothetical protein
MTEFNNWCKAVGVSTLCDYNDPKILRWIDRIQAAKSVELVNYQKKFSATNGMIKENVKYKI